jgi:glycosyltransferase involved in cell wall biosynthesis
MADRPLRILQIISSSATSGSERHLLCLSRLLLERGHHVEVVCPEPGWLPDVLRAAGVEVHIRQMRGRGRMGTMLFLMRKLRIGSFDVLHTHLTRAAYLGFPAGLVARVPVVTSVHIANNDPIYRRIARGRNRVVAVSHFIREMLDRIGVPSSHVEVIYNGTDLHASPPSDAAEVREELDIPTDAAVVGLVGRACVEKGHLELVRALGSLVGRHPRMHLLLVGKVEDSFRSDLMAALERAGLQGRVTLTGVRHDVPRLLDAMTFSTMPSHHETFGMAAIEASARGKAVVATRVGGLREVVVDGETGMLVDPGVEPLAKALDFLLGDPAARERMGAQGRRYVEEHFTLDRMGDRFEDLYRRVRGSSGASEGRGA